MTDDKALDTIREVIWTISQPVAQQNLIGIDPADVRSALIDAGTGLYGSGEVAGPPDQGRAKRATELAIAEIKRQLKMPSP
jgi:cell division GTPase FtsZ